MFSCQLFVFGEVLVPLDGCPLINHIGHMKLITYVYNKVITCIIYNLQRNLAKSSYLGMCCLFVCLFVYLLPLMNKTFPRTSRCCLFSARRPYFAHTHDSVGSLRTAVTSVSAAFRSLVCPVSAFCRFAASPFFNPGRGCRSQAWIC